MDMIFLSLLLIILIAASAFFSSSESAFFSLSSTRVKTYSQSSNTNKKLIANLLKHPRDLLVTVFMLNTLVNVLVQNVASSMFGIEGSWVEKIVMPMMLILVFGEMIPKYLGIQNNIFIAELTAPSFYFIQKLVKPIRIFIVMLTEPISRMMFYFLKKEESISEDELEHVLQKSEEFGVLKKEEANLARGYLKLQNSSVKEIMRPREDILFYSIEDPLSKLIYLLVDQKCSRIPIIKDTIDHILGIISAKQFFIHKDQITLATDLIPFLAKPFYVPEHTSAPILLRQFIEKNEELSIVVDEYGSISGLISYEDLNEVVVGEIHDSRDQRKLYTKTGEHEIIASGKLDLSIFNEVFKMNLESDHNMTIGGFIIEKLGEIPKSGTKHEMEGFLFQILAANPNRIRRIYVRKL